METVNKACFQCVSAACVTAPTLYGILSVLLLSQLMLHSLDLGISVLYISDLQQLNSASEKIKLILFLFVYLFS